MATTDPRVFRLDDVQKIVSVVLTHGCSPTRAIYLLDKAGEITSMHWEGARTVAEVLASEGSGQ